jgi:flagellar basal-body rod protein FlgF
MRTLDVIANNIANTSTTGFKANRLIYRSVEAAEFDDSALATVEAAPAGDQTITAQSPLPSRALGVTTGGMMDLSIGSVRQTGAPLDIALSGDGFLAVQTPRGERYTRSGALMLDSTGQLITAQGDLVIGEGGPITIRPGQVSIGEDGSISVDGQAAGRLKLVQFQDPLTELIKEGDSLFASVSTEPPQEATQTRVLQGMLESSNVNSIEEMAAMMQNNREFESLQRSVTLLMSMRKLSAEIGKI